jgi:hypothetical protein
MGGRKKRRVVGERRKQKLSGRKKKLGEWVAAQWGLVREQQSTGDFGKLR